MTRPFRGRTAFTLVELLVVIVIIAMLMGILLPAVNAVREAGRRTTCVNNQFQQAFAMIRFNNTNGYVPGHRNAVPVGTGTSFFSWPVVILPNMERKDVWNSVLNGTVNSGTAPYISFFVCPSTPPDALTFPTLAYAGSVGAGDNNSTLRGSGVLLDTAATGSLFARVSMDDVANNDGTATTLILSEKCGRSLTTSGSWNAVSPSTWIGYVLTGGPTPVFGLVGVAPSLGTKIINSTATTIPNFNNMPSSNHPGGVVVAFCDGHTGFLKDTLRRDVYAQLMSWNHAGITIGTTPANWAGTYLLQEGDYQ